VQIKVEFEGAEKKHWIRKRQSVQELLAHMNMYPKSQHNYHWIYDQGREMTPSVVTHDWDEDELLQIWRTPSHFEEEAQEIPSGTRSLFKNAHWAVRENLKPCLGRLTNLV
jgi:hypothetical protein